MDAQAGVHPSSLEETPPPLLLNVYNRGISFLEENGWYLLGGLVILLYVWSKVYAIVMKWLDDRAEREFRAKYHKDPDLFQMRQEAQEVARQRMQMEYDAKAQLAEEKRKEREEQKRQEWLSRQPGHVLGSGRRLSGSSNVSLQSNGSGKPKKDTWKPDYNPLSGGGGGSGGYRPPPRGCPGGGCGR